MIRLMWIVVFSIVSHPCEVTDVLNAVMFEVSIDTVTDLMFDVETLSVMEIVLMATPPITWEFLAGVVVCVLDVLTDILDVVIIGVLSNIDVDMLADENANGLAAVMTPLEFTLPSP